MVLGAMTVCTGGYTEYGFGVARGWRTVEKADGHENRTKGVLYENECSGTGTPEHLSLLDSISS